MGYCVVLAALFSGDVVADTQYIRVDYSRTVYWGDYQWAAFSFSCPANYVVTGFITDGSNGTCTQSDCCGGVYPIYPLKVERDRIYNSRTSLGVTEGQAHCSINGTLVCAKVCN